MEQRIAEQLGKIDCTLHEVNNRLDRVQAQITAFSEKCVEHRVSTGKLEARVNGIEAAMKACAQARTEASEDDNGGGGLSKKMVAIVGGLIAVVTVLVSVAEKFIAHLLAAK